MDNKGNVQNDRSREIDILELFIAIGRGIRKFFKAIIDVFLFLFVFGIRRIYWLALFGLAGAVIGFLIFLNTKRFYSSEMIAQPNGFTSIDMANYINDIHNMCIHNNYQGLANELLIDTEVAEKIRNIEAFFFIDVNGDKIGDLIDYHSKYNPKDTTTAIIQNRIIIKAEVFDNFIFKEVKRGLLNYINKNPYLIIVNDLSKQELNARIQQAEYEINKLDSLQNFEYYTTPADRQGQSRDGQLIFMNEKQTQLYYQDKVSLLDRKLLYQKTLELATTPITIIKDFTVLNIEENPSAKYIVTYGFYTGVSGYILLLLIGYWRKIKGYLSIFGR